jgi:non-ribosomal peptide synthetase component F
MKKETLEYVTATQVAGLYCKGIKQTLKFWESFSSSCPFTWGDCNRSLVTAEAFADHCQEVLPDTENSKKFLEAIRDLGQTYIDMEN